MSSHCETLEMMLKILTILPILSIYVDGFVPNDHEQKHAVSSQSFYRGDVPIFYKSTSAHVYPTTPRPDRKDNLKKANPAYHIQYAPLASYTHPQNTRTVTEQENSSEDPKKVHLEPRVLTESLDEHDQHYRSFVPGHNIAVFQSKRFNYKYPYHPGYDTLQQQKNVEPKVSVYRHLEAPLQFNVEDTQQQISRGSNNYDLYNYMPMQKYEKITNTQFVIQQPQFYQSHVSKAPRLHLNIARVYGFAHIPEQEPVHIPIAPSPTNGVYFQQHPQKTMLYPVQDIRKNYPLQVAQ